MSDIELDYDYLTQKALRNVIADVLTITAEMGEAPGEHHFYIEFLTQAPGVSLPDHLIETYPDRMTIVLQHQFSNLKVEDEGFSVTLSFKGKPSNLEIPFDAVTSFADPSVKFGLRFDPEPLDGEESQAQSSFNETSIEPDSLTEPLSDQATIIETASVERASKKEAEADNKSEDETQPSADVVSLDAFRKK